MQVVPIVLVAIVLARDARLGINLLDGHPWWSAAAAVVPVFLLSAVAQMAVSRSMRKADQRGFPRALFRAERIVRWLRGSAVVHHACIVLLLGWLDTVRSVVGNTILIDELITMMPAVLLIVASWWVFYPVEVHIREASLARRLDLGQPVYPLPARGGFVLLQLRLHLLLLFVPILLILGLSEAIDQFVRTVGEDRWPIWAPDAMTIAGAAAVFVMAPLLARMMLSVTPIPPGELRASLAAICRRHRVRVRDLLLWHTHGTMINAAVMGLLGIIRYVLITDALLESMTQRQIEAVMAHEVGHVRRHHMPWMALSLLAVILGCAIIVEVPVILLYLARFEFTEQAVQWISLLASALVMIVALTVFGWVCRRFERQADTFAVQHLSRSPDNPAVSEAASGNSEPAVVTAEAINAMSGALATIADLNGIEPDRPSWRHGSIGWRQRYLRSLVGLPLDRLPIDGLIRRLKLATIVVLAVGVMGTVAIEALYNSSPLREDESGDPNVISAAETNHQPMNEP